jgi:hypothetical protein
LPRGHWRVLTKRELQSLHVRSSSSETVAAGADRGSRRPGRLTGAGVNAPGYNHK